ncbi:MAG: HAD family hydrolase [Mycoplasma sp.]|nr:HAD family hydrolase [Mycoplasma sp.]
MKFKMIVTDLDGTFLKYPGVFVDSAVEAFHKLKEKGITTVLATGRSMVGLSKVIEKTKFDYIISGNGSYIIDINKDEVIYKKLLSKELVNELTDWLNNKNISWCVEGPNKIVFNDTENNRNHPYAKTNPYKNLLFKNSFDDEASKVMFLNIKNYDHLEKMIKEKFPNKFSFFRMRMTLEITSKDVNKYLGLNIIKNKLDIDNKSIIGIGDSGNDIEMIKGLTHSVAMGNAQSIVKNEAKYITENVDKDGWSKILYKLGVIE